MRIGLAQLNTIVGDLPGNRQRAIDAYRKLVADGAEIVLFPELMISGYPPRDLLWRSRFLADCQRELEAFAQEVGEVPAAIGFPEASTEPQQRPWNSLAWCCAGKVEAIGRKSLLPTYDVFDESRYFQSADASLVVEHQGLRIGLTICEDIWTEPEVGLGYAYPKDPLEALSEAKVDLVLNASASPWHFRKPPIRLEVVQAAARRCGCPVVYVNAIGGNDELIFDGRSLVVAPDGAVQTELVPFAEATLVVDLSGTASGALAERSAVAEIEDALVLGLRDYAHKSGFRKALLGLSGGIDSAVVACLAAKALGPENVTGISLPSAISSQHSRDDAADLARNLGITFHTVAIAGVVDAAEAALAPVLAAGSSQGVAAENLQARSRGLLLMGMSNQEGALLLTTGNKSELAVGYCTLYGDMAGGLAVISDVAKERVYELARHLNRDGELVPESTITKPPSAELRPDQKDEDSLPPYAILDAILERYVEQHQSRDEIVAAGFDAEVVKEVLRLVDRNEYKRKQAAPGLKTTPLAFGIGRRIPIVQRYVE